MSEKIIIEFCPHCCNTTSQVVKYIHRYEPITYNTRGIGKKSEDMTFAYIICICQTCDEILLYQDFTEPDWELMYPNFKLDNSVPKIVRDCYMEAISIRVKAPNAYTIMIRKCLEAICHDRGTQKGTLYVKLKELSDRGEIPSTILNLTTILRELGNVGAHNVVSNVTVPMTWEIDKFFKLIVEYIYVAPSKLNEFEKEN